MAPSSTHERNDVDYRARRRETFARIDELPAIRISEAAPRADMLLSQVREERGPLMALDANTAVETLR